MEGGLSRSKSDTRNCTLCGEPIPQQRLKVKPNAHECVNCLEASGDVPLTKRFDEHTPNGIVHTTFIANRYVEQAMARSRRHALPTEESLTEAIDATAVYRSDGDMEGANY